MQLEAMKVTLPDRINTMFNARFGNRDVGIRKCIDMLCVRQEILLALIDLT